MNNEQTKDFVGEPVLTEALKLAYGQPFDFGNYPPVPPGLVRRANCLKVEMWYNNLQSLRGDFVYLKIDPMYYFCDTYLVRNMGEIQNVCLMRNT